MKRSEINKALLSIAILLLHTGRYGSRAYQVKNIVNYMCFVVTHYHGKAHFFSLNIQYTIVYQKGNVFMPNYRNNAMPYNNYRTAQTPNSMVRRDMWNDKTLAMAYVPWQTWRDIYEVEKALEHGTIFSELDKPFLGRGGAKR